MVATAHSIGVATMRMCALGLAVVVWVVPTLVGAAWIRLDQ